MKSITIYEIRHEEGQDYWGVYFGEVFVQQFRAKSRSKGEIQRLLDHINKRLLEANGKEVAK